MIFQQEKRIQKKNSFSVMAQAVAITMEEFWARFGNHYLIDPKGDKLVMLDSDSKRILVVPEELLNINMIESLAVHWQSLKNRYLDARLQKIMKAPLLAERKPKTELLSSDIHQNDVETYHILRAKDVKLKSSPITEEEKLLKRVYNRIKKREANERARLIREAQLAPTTVKSILDNLQEPIASAG